jgi:6-phosphogluconate dehydrogenase
MGANMVRDLIKATIGAAVPTTAPTASLYRRVNSRGEADYADKLLSAMRFEFGGHLEKLAKKSEAA